MKKFLSLLSLAALIIGLLGSCAEINERLDKLESQIGGIENETIKSIDGQISAINSSIADLGSIRSSIQSLTQTAGSQGEDITALQSADVALGGRIDELKSYVNGELVNYAKTEWVEATFLTLEEYEKTCDTIAKIDARIGALDTRLSGEIAAVVDSLNWINARFGSYYTAAQMDAKLKVLQADIDSTDAENKAKADSIASELAEAKAAVDSAKANIRAEYRTAVDTAITALDGKLSKALQDSIAAVNNRIDHLAGWVKAIDKAVVALRGRVEKLEQMIQSVVIVPAYSDGSVEVKDDSLFIDFVITPKDSVAKLTKNNIKILLNKVQTKAVALDTVPTDSIKVFTTDANNGTVSIKAHIKQILAELGDKSLAVAVNVTKDKSNYTTEFVPVTLPISVRLDKHSIVVQSPDSDKDTTLTATVKNAKDINVSWTSSNKDIATVDVNGKVTIKANVSGKDTIVVKTVEGAKTDTCFVSVLPKGALAGEFTVNAKGKQVYFSKGNLVASVDASGNATVWKFAAHQYDYVGNASGNATIGTEAGDVDLFGWSTDAVSNNWGIHTKTATTQDYTTGDFKDWGTAIDGNVTWRTLSKDEWTYLFNTRNNASSLYKYGVTVCGKQNCVVLLPDNWEWNASTVGADWQKNTGGIIEYSESTAIKWSTMEKAGAVCLPAAGSRNGSGVSQVGDLGSYWSSTIGNMDNAYNVNFNSYIVSPNQKGSCSRGSSVRLVTESK